MTTSPTFIPGYLATVTLMAEDISAIGSVVSLEKTRNVMTKPTFGSPYGHSLGGQKIAAFSANGHLSAEQAAALEDIFDSDAPIDFTLQVGEGAGATDAGVHSGKCVVSSYRIEANADGQVRVKGLADFSRDLKRVDTRLAKTLAAANKTVASRVAEKVKPAVRSLAAPASSRTSGGITGRATGRKGKLAFSQAKRSRPLVAHILGADWHMVHGRPVKADSMRSRVWQPHLGSRWSAGDLYGAGPVIVKAADSFIVDEYADAIMDAFAVAFPEKA